MSKPECIPSTEIGSLLQGITLDSQSKRGVLTLLHYNLGYFLLWGLLGVLLKNNTILGILSIQNCMMFPLFDRQFDSLMF